MADNTTLHIEKSYSGCGIDTFLITGLSVAETDRILNAKEDGKDDRDVLAEILDAHENDYRNGNLGTCWRCGYGIYSIRHFGGHLIVEVGNSCD